MTVRIYGLLISAFARLDAYEQGIDSSRKIGEFVIMYEASAYN